MCRGTTFATVLTDRHLNIEWASASVIDSIGFTAEELVGRSAVTLLHPDDLPRIAALILAQQEEPQKYEVGGDPARRALNGARLQRSDGSYVHCEFAATNLSDDPLVGGYFLYLRVADDRRYLEMAYQRMASGAQSSDVVNAVRSMLLSQFDEATIDISLSASEIHESHEVADPWHFQVLGSESEGVACISVSHDRKVDGPTLWAQHVIENAARILQILAHREALMSQLQQAAVTDPLTGLRNRRGFMDALYDSVPPDSDTVTAVLYLDIDNFKGLNDAYGHTVGDAALVAIADRLSASVREVDVVGRLGGDEFAILCHGVLPGALQSMSDRLHQNLDKPIEVGDVVVGVSLSMGIATSSGTDWSEMLRDADLALMQAKADGKHRSVFSGNP